jgi:hypothetical protein
MYSKTDAWAIHKFTEVTFEPFQVSGHKNTGEKLKGHTDKTNGLLFVADMKT